jgi:uncharacterized protein YndB with AHSA1/START domain
MKGTAMTLNRYGSARVELPNELDVLITRKFDAPIALVFEVLTKPEHASKWGATGPDQMKECSIDLRVGGAYRSVFITGDGDEFIIQGTYLEVEPPTRTVETWLFNFWPDAEAVETMGLHETDGVTTLTIRKSFRDKAGRNRMAEAMSGPGADNGQQVSFDAMEDILRTLLDTTDASHA